MTAHPQITPTARLATAEDVPEIVRICSAGWRRTYVGLRSTDDIEAMIIAFYTPERVASEIGVSGPEWNGYVVAEAEQTVLAAGGGGMTGPSVGELFVLYADPDRLRRGAGTAVLAVITEQQRRQGAREQWVSVEPGNELGLAFYHARGFTPRGRRAAYAGDGESLRLSRPIPERPFAGGA